MTAASGYTLRDVFAGNFGVWREAEGGRVMVFEHHFPTRDPAARARLCRLPAGPS
jgi:hypothetical protein